MAEAVEDLNVGIGKLAVAFFSMARAPTSLPKTAMLAKSNIDVRLYDLKGPAGLWTRYGSIMRPRKGARRWEQ